MNWPNSVDWSLRAAPETSKESFGGQISVKYKHNQRTFIEGSRCSKPCAKER